MGFLIIGLVAGGVIGFLVTKLLFKDQVGDQEALHKLDLEKQSVLIQFQNLQQNHSQVSSELEKLKLLQNETNKELYDAKGRLDTSRDVFLQQKQKIDELDKSNQLLNQESATYKAQLKNLEQRLSESKVEVENLQKKFITEFENLANKILDEKTQKFTLQNKEQLGQLISPFQEKIKEFEKKVDETYQKGRDQHIQLFEQIKSLSDLNQQMRSEAQNLTNALKGDKKQQGNWGELILETVLERSGLQKGIEYEMQFNTEGIDGSKIQPDVVVKLPDNKHIIVDSKVSLNAYTEWVNEPDEQLKLQHLKNHIASIKNHIKSLSEKSYHAAHAFHTPEFVLLFVPIESSFSTIIQHDSDIWNYAWEKKIVLVSPSTLLATLRTIASVWKQEKQNANSLEIARQAGDMYDKLVGFLEDMSKIEASLDQTQKAYSNAMNKLKDGNGNLIGRAERLKKLGVKSEKNIPPKFIDQVD